MGYKFKPNKSVAKRFMVTGTGKLKRGKGFHSHLMSARDAAQRRGLHRDAILFEGHAKNMRDMMGIKGERPGKVKHDRKVRAIAAAKAAKAGAAAPAAKSNKPPLGQRTKAKKAALAAAGK